MTQFFKKIRQKLTGVDPIYFCLFLALGLIAFRIGFGLYATYFLENYAIIPPILFFGVLLTRKAPPDSYKSMALGLAFVAWFVISQVLKYADGLSTHNPGTFFLVYLLAFPFAAVAQDRKNQTGLKMAGIAYLAGTMILACLTALLALDFLPGFLKPHVYWSGPRLRAMWHPNGCGCMFMIALGFSLYFFSCSKKRLHKILCIACAIIMFFLCVLTNSRTAILLSCCLLAGYVFFYFWNGTWKRLLPCALVAVVVLGLFFFLYQEIADIHTANITQQAIENQSSGSIAGTLQVDNETGEVTLTSEFPQSSLLENMSTLNARTVIWKAAIDAARSSNAVLLRGTDISTELISQFCPFPANAHNSLLEVLVTMGIPGLVFSIIFTLISLWHIIWTLFSKTASMSQKSIALLMIALLFAGMLETYLFTAVAHTDFVFFLCLGYLTQWKKHDP